MVTNNKEPKKLTAEQITKIDLALSKMGIAYMDIRCELIDHAATAIEQKEEDFDIALEEYIKLNKKQLKKTNRKMFFAGMGKAYRQLFQNMVKPVFIIGTVLLFAALMLLTQIINIELITQLSFLVFCLIGTVTSSVFLFRTFRYRRSYSGVIPFGFIVLGLLYLNIFMMDWQHYINSNIALMYYTVVVMLMIGIGVTGEQQYKHYKLRYIS